MRVSLLLILACATIPRFYDLDRQSIWRDETRTLAQALQPAFQDGIDLLLKADVHPPLNLVVTRGWVSVFGGDDLSMLRALPALFSLAGVLVVFLIGRLLAGNRVGLLAALIHGGSLMQVYYAQEFRSYSLLALLAAVSMLAFSAWLTHRRITSLAGYVAATSLLMYTHVFAVFVVFTQNVIVAGQLFRTRSELTDGRMFTVIREWIIAQIAVLVIFAPWIPSFLIQLEKSGTLVSWVPDPDIWSIFKMLFMSISWSRPPWATGSLPVGQIAIAAGLLVPAALAVDHLVRTRLLQPAAEPDLAPVPVDRKLSSLIVLAWALVPILVAWILSMIGDPVFTYRNLIIVTPAVSIGLAMLVMRTRWAPARAVIIALSLAAFFGNIGWYYTETHKEDWRSAQKYVTDNFRPGDQIVTSSRLTAERLRATFYINLDNLPTPDPVFSARSGKQPTGRLWNIGFRTKKPARSLLQIGYKPVASQAFFDGPVTVLYDR